MPRRVSRLTSLFGITALVVVLTGCFSIESTFTVHDDATADVSFLVLVNSQQIEQMAAMLGEDADALGDLSGEALLEEMLGGDDPCVDLESDLSGYEVTTREIDEGGQVGVECTVSNVPLAELNDSMESDGEARFSIEQDASGTRFNATLDGVDELALDSEEMGAIPGFDFDDLVSIVFNVSAPGSLGANNATSTSGSTASWKITPGADFVVGGAAEMHAEWSGSGGGSGGGNDDGDDGNVSGEGNADTDADGDAEATVGDDGLPTAAPDDSSDGSSTLWIILGIVAALAALGLIYFLVKRNKKGDGTPGSASDGAAPLAAPGAPVAPVAPVAPPASPTPPPPPAATDVPPPPPMAPPTPPSS